MQNDCPGGRVFCPPSSRVPGVCSGGGMVLDEIDSCITSLLGSQVKHEGSLKVEEAKL